MSEFTNAKDFEPIALCDKLVSARGCRGNRRRGGGVLARQHGCERVLPNEQEKMLFAFRRCVSLLPWSSKVCDRVRALRALSRDSNVRQLGNNFISPADAPTPPLPGSAPAALQALPSRPSQTSRRCRVGRATPLRCCRCWRLLPLRPFVPAACLPTGSTRQAPAMQHLRLSPAGRDSGRETGSVVVHLWIVASPGTAQQPKQHPVLA